MKNKRRIGGEPGRRTERSRRDAERVSVRDGLGLGVFLLVFLFPVAALGAPVPAGARPGDEAGLTLAEGQALLRIIRARVTPDLLPPETSPTPVLDKPDRRTLVVEFYRNGSGVFHCTVEGADLRHAADEAGRRLAAHFAKPPNKPEMLRDGRVKVDLVLERIPLKRRDRMLAGLKLDIGREGLVCKLSDRTVFFTPLTIMCHSKSDFIVRSFVERESRSPPRYMRMERLRTIAFVESKPGAAARRLIHGNTLRLESYAPEVSVSDNCLRAGLWLLKAQQKDGSFLTSWFPGAEKEDRAYPRGLVDHVRATLALTQFCHLTKDPQCREAQQRALRYAGKFLETRRRLGLAYLQVKQDDDVMATALLLTTLCRQELVNSKPTADRLLRYLGEYLCTLVDEDGRLHPKLTEALGKKPRRIVHGAPYDEVLIALCLLEQVSPRERVRQSIRRLLKCMRSLRRSAPAKGPRTIEAFAQAYIVERDPKLGNLTFALGIQLAKGQLTERAAASPDFVGGFREPNLAPTTFTAAQAVSGLATAYQMGRVLGRPASHLAEPVRQGARFLGTMQFRDENTFFLRRKDIVLGGFRKGADDLTLQVGAAAEAIRALMAALRVMTEAVPPKPASSPELPQGR